MRRFAVSYVDALLHGDDYGDLASLSSMICSAPSFSRTAPYCGLPLPVFTFVETLCWFAMGVRSGVLTYYESTPVSRQWELWQCLRQLAPRGYAEWYERGMTDWEEEEKLEPVDQWIVANDDAAHHWLRKLLVENRGMLLELT